MGLFVFSGGHKDLTEVVMSTVSLDTIYMDIETGRTVACLMWKYPNACSIKCSQFVVQLRSPFFLPWYLCVHNVIHFMCPHLKATLLCVSLTSCNTNLASSDLSAAQEKYTIRHAARLYWKPSSQTHASGWHANYYYIGVCELQSAHAQNWEREGWVICARQEEDGGSLEEEREEGDITKLHLKLVLSLLESPCTLSLAFLGGFGAQARFFNRNRKRDCCIKEINVKVLALWSKPQPVCPADPHTLTPTSMPTHGPQPPSLPARGLT